MPALHTLNQALRPWVSCKVKCRIRNKATQAAKTTPHNNQGKGATFESAFSLRLNPRMIRSRLEGRNMHEQADGNNVPLRWRGLEVDKVKGKVRIDHYICPKGHLNGSLEKS